MRTEYQIQRLAGYTDGKKSWQKLHIGRRCYSQEEAWDALDVIRIAEPDGEFRAKKVYRK